jgi:hypothetical protein
MERLDRIGCIFILDVLYYCAALEETGDNQADCFIRLAVVCLSSAGWCASLDSVGDSHRIKCDRNMAD